jgi:sporulation protein YlmC with PRC-barrel domain
VKAIALDLVREVLDHELTDADGVPCGMVDDVELDGDIGGTLQVVALLSGPGVAQSRLPAPIGRVLRAIFGARRTRIEWRHVKRIGERIELDVRASELRLDAVERRLGQWIAKVPGA